MEIFSWWWTRSDEHPGVLSQSPPPDTNQFFLSLSLPFFSLILFYFILVHPDESGISTSRQTPLCVSSSRLAEPLDVESHPAGIWCSTHPPLYCYCKKHNLDIFFLFFSFYPLRHYESSLWVASSVRVSSTWLVVFRWRQQNRVVSQNSQSVFFRM